MLLVCWLRFRGAQVFFCILFLGFSKLLLLVVLEGSSNFFGWRFEIPDQGCNWFWQVCLFLLPVHSVGSGFPWVIGLSFVGEEIFPASLCLTKHSFKPPFYPLVTSVNTYTFILTKTSVRILNGNVVLSKTQITKLNYWNSLRSNDTTGVYVVNRCLEKQCKVFLVI